MTLMTRTGLPRGLDRSTVDLALRYDSHPSAKRTRLINDLIVAGKDHGWWFCCDLLLVTAMGLDDPGYTTADDAHAARRNWIQDAFNATAVGSPTFVTDRHYKGTPTGYLNSNFNPGDGGSYRYKLNDAHLSGWNRLSRGTQNRTTMGAGTGTSGTNRIYWNPIEGSNFTTRINSTSVPTVANADSVGHFVVSRAASNQAKLYIRGALAATVGSNSVSIPNAPIGILAGISETGATSSPSLDELAVISAGSSLSDTLAAHFEADLKTYLTAVGAA